MKNRKQSAVSRRMSGADTEVVFQNLSNSVSTINNILGGVADQTNTNTTSINQVSEISLATQGLLQNQLDPSIAGSLVARIVDLENNPSGGGGTDPSDPNQPIVVVDNFLRQPNGDPTGVGVTPYLFPSTETVVMNSFGSFEIQTTGSETNHIGIIIGRIPAFDSLLRGLCLGREENSQVCVFTEVNHMYFIFKTPATLGHNIRIGFLDDHNSSPPNNGVYFERLIGDATFFAVTRSGGTQTRTSTTITYSADTWYVLKIRRTPSNEAEFTVDSNTPLLNTTNIPTSYLNPGCQIQGSGSESTNEDFKFDFFSLKLGDDPAIVPGGVFYGPPDYEETKTFSYDVDDNLEELTWTVGGETYTQDFYYNLDGTLNYIEWIRGGNTYRKTFTWNLDGTLASAIITEL